MPPLLHFQEVLMVLEVVVYSVAIVVSFVLLALLHRRSRHRADTLGRFSAATRALRDIAEHPSVLEAVHVEETPSVHVLDEVVVLKLDRTRLPRPSRRGRADTRLDAEALARRPTIASLPSISATDFSPPDPGRRAG
jgi:hypothetical protein